MSIQKNPVLEGPIPGDPGTRYSFDSDTSVLRFLDVTNNNEEVAVARMGRDGFFFEEETGIPVAQMVDGNLVFDPVSLANVDEDL